MGIHPVIHVKKLNIFPTAIVTKSEKDSLLLSIKALMILPVSFYFIF